MSRAVLRVGVWAALGALVWLVLPAPASAAQASEWEIRSFDAAIVITEEGAIEVTETIEVTFHVASRGIFREIPFRVPVEGDNVRVYQFTQVAVQTSQGAPGDLQRDEAGDYLVWRIGDPDTFITGEYTYVISYRVVGALNRFDSHDELFWNVTGDRWEVPIQRASATVQAPGITDVRCFAGLTGQTDPCAGANHDGQTASFTAGTLPAGSQLDVVVAMAPGAVDVPPPTIEPANPVRRFIEVQLPQVFHVDVLRLGAAGVIGLSGMLAVGLLARRGRDEQAATVPGGLPGGVEYRPPDGLRPAQLRTLLTERVDDVSLAATLVDLAVRNHLRIEEVARTGLAKLSRQDWIIHRLPPPADGLQPYEQEVMRGLFSRQEAHANLSAVLSQSLSGGEQSSTDVTPGAASVKVEELRNGVFAPHYKRVKTMLYGDVVQRGFYRRSPQAVRRTFGVLSLLVLAVGVAGLYVMFYYGVPYGLVLAPLPIVGLLLLIFSQRAPRRTAAGAAVNQRARGFRDFIETAEADRMDFAERERLFVDYLPYAMVFGCVDHWVRAFAQVGMPAAAAAGDWYVGHGPMDVGHMTSAMSSLSSQVGGSMRHTASSGGSSGMSGSSGGGGGGGGGGRW
jgi:uncharacterized membrane protein YgcG